MGKIPDWTPVEYKPEGIQVPHYHLDTPTTGMDIAAQYHSVSRMDQGFGLFLKTLKEYGYENNTLMILTADNGIPFPNAKTNLYDSGMEDLEPMIISNPMATERWGQKSSALVSTVDIVPTVMDWFGLEYPEYRLFGLNPVILQGRSLLPILKEEPDIASSPGRFCGLGTRLSQTVHLIWCTPVIIFMVVTSTTPCGW